MKNLPKSKPYIAVTHDGMGEPHFHAAVIPAPTWNDAINAMSAEEKIEMLGEIANGSCAFCVLIGQDVSCKNTCCKKCIAELFNSPYDGGKTQEGAE